MPAVYGITSDPYLVFVTNAFALLGLRALYFVLEGALSKLAHLGYGLATILAFEPAQPVQIVLTGTTKPTLPPDRTTCNERSTIHAARFPHSAVARPRGAFTART